MLSRRPPSKMRSGTTTPYSPRTEEPGLPVEIPGELRQVLGGLLGGNQRGEKQTTRYDFLSEDEVWTATLTRDFLALTTVGYTTWADFRARFAALFETLNAEYTPGSFTRLGLRYKNLIRRSHIELTDSDWNDLIEPHILGPLATDAIAGRDVSDAKGVLALAAGNGGAAVTLRHGLVKANDRPDDGELSYLIDSDFYTEERTNAGGVLEFLDAANADAGRLFRWCITPRLHEALEPVTGCPR